MGNSPSHSRTVSAVLNLIASTIISSQTTCLAAAENDILYDIGMVNNFMMQNVTIAQDANATVRCTHNANIAVGTETFNSNFLKNQIENILGETKENGRDNVSVAATIANAITHDFIHGCIVTAQNRYKVRIEQAQGDVSLINLTLTQVATAQMALCLTSDSLVVAGGIPLTKYLANELPNFPTVQANVCPLVKFSEVYGVAGGVVGLIIVVILFTVWRFKVVARRQD